MKVTESSITGLVGSFETDDKFGKGKIFGDVETAKQTVKEAKEIGRNRRSHYQHMAEIPPVVVIELLEKHRIDLLDPEFAKDPATMNRFKYILKTEYPDLLVMT